VSEQAREGEGIEHDAHGAAPPPPPSPQPPALTRTELARAALQPLAPGERPRALLVAMAICALLAVGVVVGALSVHDLARHGGSLPGAAVLAGVLAALAIGMARTRYWAVLGFEALLAFQIMFSSLALIVASTLLAAGECLVGISLGGLLFWKLVRVMGRIQAGERARSGRLAG
jgi:hypothetical protein